MRTTKIACEVRDGLYGVEAELAAVLASAKAFEAQLVKARADVGLKGNYGDAAIARVRDVVASLEAAKEDMISGHSELHTILQNLAIPGVAISPKILSEGCADEGLRAA